MQSSLEAESTHCRCCQSRSADQTNVVVSAQRSKVADLEKLVDKQCRQIDNLQAEIQVSCIYWLMCACLYDAPVCGSHLMCSVHLHTVYLNSFNSHLHAASVMLGLRMWSGRLLHALILVGVEKFGSRTCRVSVVQTFPKIFFSTCSSIVRFCLSD